MKTNKRIKTLISGAVAIGAILMMSATPALAGGNNGHRGKHYDGGDRDHRGHHDNRRHQRHYHQRHYRDHGPRYYSDHRVHFNYVPVPVVRQTVIYEQPVQAYYSAPSSYGTGYRTGYRTSTVNGGNLVGGAIDGYLGSTVGHGSTRLAATAAGAVIGYSLGGQVGSRY
ncbi:MAG: hypothetical protein O3C28_02100 [Proteobacteria bacterium]|nr:hypothetical protein [Pseudomonadota bacterium]